MSTQLETEIGMVAGDWKLVELGSVCEKPQYGFTASSASNGNAKFLRITDIDDLGVNWDDVPFCICTDDEFNKYRLYSGDIVFARIGATTGKSHLIKNPPKAVFASYLIRVRPKPEIDPEFLIHFFRSDAYWRQVNANKNSNLKKGVNGSVLNTLLIPQPSVSEQYRIARVLSKVQNAIEQQARLIALTRELKSALMRKLFTEGLRGEKQKETEIGIVPESWTVERLSSLFTIKHGYGFKGEYFKPEGEYILLTPGHFFEEGGFRDQREKTKFYTGEIPDGFILQKGDLLIAMTEQKAGLLGSSIIIPESNKYLHNQRLGLIQNSDNRLDKEFLFYYFNTSYPRTEIFSTATGSKVRHTSPSKVLNLKIAFPAIEEQREITNTLKTIDRKLVSLKEKNLLLEELFRTLLHQLMTGQVRVNEIDLPGIS